MILILKYFLALIILLSIISPDIKWYIRVLALFFSLTYYFYVYKPNTNKKEIEKIEKTEMEAKRIEKIESNIAGSIIEYFKGSTMDFSLYQNNLNGSTKNLPFYYYHDFYNNIDSLNHLILDDDESIINFSNVDALKYEFQPSGLFIEINGLNFLDTVLTYEVDNEFEYFTHENSAFVLNFEGKILNQFPTFDHFIDQEIQNDNYFETYFKLDNERIRDIVLAELGNSFEPYFDRD